MAARAPATGFIVVDRLSRQLQSRSAVVSDHRHRLGRDSAGCIDIAAEPFLKLCAMSIDWYALRPASGCSPAAWPPTASAAPRTPPTCPATATRRALGASQASQGRRRRQGEDNTPPPGRRPHQARRLRAEGLLPRAEQGVVRLRQGAQPDPVGEDRPGCRKSLYAARYVARLVDGGFTDSEIGESMRSASATPRKSLDLGDTPCQGTGQRPGDAGRVRRLRVPALQAGAAGAAPGPGRVQRRGEGLLQALPARRRTPTRAPRPRRRWPPTSRASSGPYNDKLWAIADSLTPAAIEQIAKEVGLDVAKWRADFESEAVKARVQKDRARGRAPGHRQPRRRSTSTAACSPTTATSRACATGSTKS